uniref:J domain-containing protein n=1 Tax=Ananas comosus var. bracteatus TaxID=296719 RepID=A0A6V7QV79_ANACO
MSTLRSIARPHGAVSSFIYCYRGYARLGFAPSARNPNVRIPSPLPQLERDADEEKIKSAYRRLAKFYHPDVYNGRGSLEEGETAEARFIKIQAAYELLIDVEKRRQYDRDHRVNPLKASQAWMEWLMKKRKAFDQRGDMAIAAWAEQQQREMNLRARRLSRSKIDPEEEKRILAKEKKASMEYFSSTLRRHTLVLKKRDLMRKKAEEDKKKVITQLLAAEGLELDTDDDEAA